MKIAKLFCLLTLAASWAHGQTTAISGTVNNKKGQPVPYAFVRDQQHNYATFSDSTGAFKLKADPSSSLVVLANNYQDAQFKIDSKTKLDVVLAESNENNTVESLKNNTSTESTGFLRAREQLTAGKGVTAATGVSGGGYAGGAGGSDVVIVRSGFTLEPTRGSRYLFEDWVPGYGINKSDALVMEKTNMYNFDKISGGIVFTNDGKSMAQVSPSQLISFTLYDKKGHAHVYENAPDVSDKPFVEVLLSTSKYKIYKRIDSKLTVADFHTDGVLEIGHRYDEYTDVDRYFFVADGDTKPKGISLKKSTLKKVLNGDADAFIASQGSRDVDEEYVKELGASLTK